MFLPPRFCVCVYKLMFAYEVKRGQGCMDVRYRCVCVCVRECMHACMHACMYICTYIITLFIYQVSNISSLDPTSAPLVLQPQTKMPHPHTHCRA